MIKCTLFEIWKKAELERGRRITVIEVVNATGLSRNTIQGLLDDKTSRFDAPVFAALCRYFDVPPGPIPFLQYVPDDSEHQ